MRVVSFITFIILLNSFQSMGQQYQRVLKAIDAKEWESAVELSKKNLMKDSTDAVVHYQISQILLYKKKPDSALYHFRQSDKAFRISTEKEIKKTAKYISINALNSVKNKIDTTGFNMALKHNNLASWNHYISLYYDSYLLKKAINRRDSIAYNQVKREGSITSYQNFLKKYPNSAYAEKVNTAIHLLSFNEVMHTGGINDLRSFLKANPNTKFRIQLLSKILKLQTIDHDKRGYLDFVEEYKTDTAICSQIAWASLYNRSFSKSEKLSLIKYVDNPNKYRKMAEALDSSIALYYRDDHYHLIMSSGKTHRLNTTLQNLNQDFFCKTERASFLHEDRKRKTYILNILGDTLKVTNKKKISSKESILILGDPSKADVYNLAIDPSSTLESPILRKVSNIEIIEGCFIKYKNTKGYGLMAMNNYTLLENMDEINFIGDNIFLIKKNGKMALIEKNELIASSKNNTLDLHFEYDDIIRITEDAFIAIKNNKETIITKNSKKLHPLVSERLNLQGNYWIGKNKTKGVHIYTNKMELVLDDYVEEVSAIDDILLYKKEDKWYDIKFKDVGFDSLKMFSNGCYLKETSLEKALVFENNLERKVNTGEVAFEVSYEGSKKALIGIGSSEKGSIYLSDGTLFHTYLRYIPTAIFEHYTFGKRGKNNFILNNEFELIVNAAYTGLEYIGPYHIIGLRKGLFETISLTKETKPKIIGKSKHKSHVLSNGKLLLAKGESLIYNYKSNEKAQLVLDGVTLQNDQFPILWLTKEGMQLIYQIDSLKNNVTLLVEGIKEVKSLDDSTKIFTTEKGSGLQYGHTLIFKDLWDQIRRIKVKEKYIFRAEKFDTAARMIMHVYKDETGLVLYRAAMSEEEEEHVICD